ATDANNDGYINKAEQGSATTDTVNIGLPSNAKAGDTLNVTINGVVQSGHVLTAAEITAGKVVLTPAAPADGSTLTVTASVSDPAGNTSASASDTAKIDLTAPTIAIATTLSGDDVINAAEHNQSLLVSGSTVGVENGQKVDVVLNNVHYSATVSGNSWSVTVPATDVAKLADGSVTVTANVSDAAGNAATPATHALTVDTTLPTINLVSNVTTTQLFNTTWEATNQTTTATTAEGWTLVTSNDVAPGGINGFEIWTSSDTMTTASGSSFTPASSTGTGNAHWIELNNSTSNIIQTLGITRTVATVAGAEYQLSMDFAGRPGYSTDVNKIGIYVDGKLVAEYSATSASTLDWRNISFDFTGTGGNQVITILTDTPASAVDANGRGAMVDNIVLTQGGFQASDAATTTIALSSLMTASHPVAVSSETLTLNVSGLTSAEGSPSLVLHGTTYTPDASGNLTVTGLSLSDLQSGSLQLSGSYHGQVSFNATVTAIESNGNTATSSTVPVSFLVGAGNEVHGTAGTDYLYAGAGATLLQGGAGNDTMTSGTTGVDTFKWVLGDQGTVATPAVDTIINFKTAAVSSGGDKLDLRDLLVGESHTGMDVGNLGNYLHFTTSTTAGVTSTVIHVSETGNLASHETQQIVLQNVDLTHSGSTVLTDTQILQNLLGNGKLITD
ncbi:type I secretion C-terminal target domain-containing protein, partial [Aquitalea palustris]